MNFSWSMEVRRELRRLRRTPGFSLGVIALLAISIGGAAAVATAGYSLFAQPLPYHQPERLVTLGVFSKRFSAHMGLSPALVNELNESEAFGRLGIVGQAQDLELDSGEVLRAGRIDQHVLQVLGLAPVAGRLFSDRDVRPGAEQVPTRPRSVGPDFFRVAGIELLRGRRFGPDDGTDAADNVVVDQLFADQYMGGDALGESFGLADGPESFTPVQIIGVVETVRHMSPDEVIKTPTVYTYSNEPLAQIQLLLRTGVRPYSLVETVRNAAVDALGEERVGFVASLESLVRRTVRDREPQLMLMGVFAGLAVVLVFYGLYALQSYQVAARSAEFGLRKAMGASGRHMLGHVLGRALLLLVPGLLLGVAGGWLGGRMVAERLYDVSSADPLLWLVVVATVGTVISIAAFVPALRAVRIAPMEALRYE